MELGLHHIAASKELGAFRLTASVVVIRRASIVERGKDSMTAKPCAVAALTRKVVRQRHFGTGGSRSSEGLKSNLCIGGCRTRVGLLIVRSISTFRACENVAVFQSLSLNHFGHRRTCSGVLPFIRHRASPPEMRREGKTYHGRLSE